MSKTYIFAVVLEILGLLLSIKAFQKMKIARKVDKRICDDRSLSDEEFQRIREEDVQRPEKASTYLVIIGIILLGLPNAFVAISQNQVPIAIISIITTAFFTLMIWKNK